MISDGGGLVSWSVEPGRGSRWIWRRLACTPGGVPERAGRPADGAGRGWLRGRAGALVVAVLVVSAAVAACSDGGAQAGATASAGRTARPSAAASARASASGDASASATPTLMLTPEEQASRDAALATPEPARVEGMDEHSSYGAAQTAAYFLSLYPYVYATGDLATWQDMSQDTCTFCNSVITNVTEIHSDGGWSDPWQAEIAVISYGVDPDDPERYVVTTNFVNPEYTAYSGRPLSMSSIPARDVTVLVQVYWQGDKWVVEQGEVK